MGLDQHAYVSHFEGEEQFEICYWRKHANLQGWMERLWYSKGYGKNPEEIFNCRHLELTYEDLKNLEREHNNLPLATGFFWGISTSDDIVKTASFIVKAKEMIKKGYKIYYFCSY